MERSIVGLGIGLVFVFSVVTGIFHYRRETQNVTRVAQDRLLSIAITAAAALDGDAHEELNQCLDRGCPNYSKLASYLRQVQAGNGLSTEVYTLARTARGTRFVVRTNREGDIGMPYDLRPEMTPVFSEGTSAVTGLYRDRYGTWLSAYAPVKNRSGRTVALLEADYKAGEVLALLRQEAVEFALVSATGLLLTFLLARRLARRLVRPMAELTAAVDAVENDADVPLPLEATGEIGLLARRFAAMRERVRQARLQDRLALVGRMAGTLVHDLRGPLTVVSGMTELIISETELEERQGLASRVLVQVKRIEAMAQEVLDFSRGSSKLERTRLRIGPLLESVCSDLAGLARERRVRLRFPEARDEELWGDPNRLWRLFYNLVKNALEVTPPGAEVELSTWSDGTHLGISVRDEGPGIPPAVARRLFEPFFSHGKSGGTGLGLTIARSVAEAHGGMLTFRSGAGYGTVFRVLLPIDRSDVIAQDSPRDTMVA